MPFHAAGNNSPDSTENACCRAISSYTLSAQALAHSRDRLNGTGAAQLLISAMATTPGLTKLPGVLEEKDGVMHAINGLPRAERLNQLSVG
jgi:hypothetical protein